MKQMLKKTYSKFWGLFLNSGTILLNRLEAFAGFLLGVFGAIDWNYIMTMDFSDGINKQVLFVSMFLFIRGIVGEITRRRGAKDLGKEVC